MLSDGTKKEHLPFDTSSLPEETDCPNPENMFCFPIYGIDQAMPIWYAKSILVRVRLLPHPHSLMFTAMIPFVCVKILCVFLI